MRRWLYRSEVLPKCSLIFPDSLHVDDLSKYALLFVCPRILRRNLPLLRASAVLGNEIVPVRVVDVEEYRCGLIFTSLLSYSSVEACVVDGSGLLNGFLVPLSIIEEVLLDGLLYINRQCVAVLTHHLFAETHCLDRVVLKAKDDQVLRVEAGEHRLA